MSITLAEARTVQFYDWETRCRGWQCYNEPVQLEPTFEPFIFRSPFTGHIDDGLRPTLLGLILGFTQGKSIKQIDEQIKEDLPPAPYLFEDDAAVQAISVSFPKAYKIEADQMQQLLCMLSYCQYPLSFEIIATHTSINIQIVCREPDTFHVQSQVKAFFPDSNVQISNDAIEEIEGRDGYIYTVDFGLSEEFMRPLEMVDSYDIDPFIGLFGVLENLNDGEQVMIQVLFQGVVNSWSESIIHSVTDSDGKSLFLDAPEMVDLAREKISSPLFGVTIRVLVQGNNEYEAADVIEKVGSAVRHISRSSNNSLLPLVTEGYTFDLRLQDVVTRQSHRQGMILNSKELATLVHFPSDSVVSTKLKRDARKTKAAPDSTKGHTFQLGLNVHRGKEVVASLNNTQRLKHMHVIGATGTGKSTFLLNLIVQDIEHGEGIAVLDPHGDLIESILSHIPKNRLDDVMIIDPSDSEFPVGFNILSAHSEIEKDILSSDLVAAFKRLSTSWGDQMNSVLANAILAFLESDKGGTLIDLRRFLIEKSFRDSFLKTVTDPSISYYWNKEYPILKSNSIGSILTRLDTFLRPKLIRNMVAQKTGPNFENILDTKKILLVKLSQGLIGTENSYMLGTFIVSKIHQAAMARQAKSKDLRSYYFVYIDEFQNFITPSMSSILSGARKYHLGLILAHQDMQQLTKYDTELASSVSSNAGTRVCFRIGDTDARRFESTFSSFDAHDLQNLDTGEAIVRIERSEQDFTIATTPLPEIETKQIEVLQNAVIAASRQKYGTPRTSIEEQLKALHGETSEIVQEHEPIPVISLEEPPKTKTKPHIQEIKVQKNLEQVTSKEAYTRNPVEKKEQSQHRYLQTLIKKMAESRGYKASIEEPTPDGKGRVDVLLERKGKKIACEISVTSTDIYEVHNIEKCLSAGYHLVVECSTERKTLENIRKAVEQNLPEKAQEKILIIEPEGLFLFLDKEIAKDASSETLIKGYRVKVEYDAVSENEMEKKRSDILQVVSESIRKRKP